ncbi:MAG: hypothetical protein COA42_19800 [Alteromonadaceae bacterium]|nr:MAG: hypothetical protein COA42_19800 [Alteromonadaceae bacterium]
MYIKTLLSISILLFLVGCGTRPYVPQEYELRDGVIPKLSINGDVSIANAQSSIDEAIVYSYGATQFA